MENIRKFFEKEKVCRATINWMAVVKRMAKTTGLSEKTIRTIHKEFVACDGQLLTPVKRYMASHIRVNPDTFDREAIRWLVHGFYTRREYPTLDGVLKKKQLTHTETDRDETICTNPRRDITQTIQQLDPNFVEAVLPL